MAYYSVPSGLITTVFSLTLSSLVSVPNLGEKKSHFFNYATIVKLDERTQEKNKEKSLKTINTLQQKMRYTTNRVIAFILSL